jgi:hypothetical protein
MKEILKRAFGIDYRSLAFFRIVLACVVLYDLFARLGDMSTFYLDTGLLTRFDAIQTSHSWRMSLHNISGTYWFILCTFITNIFLAIMLLVGKNTFWANVLLWIFNISLQNRNYFILNSSDTLIRMLLFWGMFLPLGARYSVDAIKNKTRKLIHLSPAGAFALLQLCYMYWFTAWLKVGDEWNIDFSAIYFALQVDQFTTSFGIWAGQFYDLLKTLTKITIYWEYLGPVLAFIPFATGYLRGFTVISFILMHAGLMACLKIGLFSAISVTGWMLFIPKGFWNWMEKKKLFRIFTDIAFSLGAMIDHLADIKVPTFKYKQVLASIFFVFITFYNLTTIESLNISRPKWVSNFSQIFRIDQQWGMFAPFPIKNDGWFVMPGFLEDETKVNAYTFEEVATTFDKPKSISSMQTNQRWRKQIMNLAKKENQKHAFWYAKWVCEKWNKNRAFGKRLESFSIYYMLEWTLDHYKTKPIERITVRNHRCF